MCIACDPPEAERRAGLAMVQEMLSEGAWITIAVEPECGRPLRSYTVGLTNHGKPELLIIGMPKERAQRILAPVSERVFIARPPAPGTRLRLPGRRRAEIVRVEEPGVHLPIAADIFGPRLTAIQLVYADQKGRWPWDKAFRDGRGGQPVLGVRNWPIAGAS